MGGREAGRWAVWGLEVLALGGFILAGLAAALTWVPPAGSGRLGAAGAALGLDFLAWSAWQAAWRRGSRPPLRVARAVPLAALVLAAATLSGWLAGR
ncbi:membrane protein of unknown function [Candidatus Hydrogenisulfobacillus filiaventi]|uniref:Uncharacterized protein n=1 Tax=Candidatus Hydrogenisulfobacillus filiaventi TaxID=2707344 RepID=A0A6F8ZGA8_9FIRM|nr:hypothetical protein [Bacillota bacterium]CAB1128632.1 membrane protein of unknown function [Candidatus Hydrogenisulfobacillus filiaventi]